tara:strand:- start:203 stop:349 length:147 start_codon:yes stop_codon:yes gene_type:complete
VPFTDVGEIVKSETESAFITGADLGRLDVGVCDACGFPHQQGCGCVQY